jgi:hypothetical protein
MSILTRLTTIVRDIVLAPFRVLLDPWGALHGQIGGLAQLSIAGVAALLTFLFLTLVAVVYALTQWINNGEFVLRDYFGIGWILAFVLIEIFTPIAVYYTVKFWMQEAGERFPEIQRAWDEGIAELRRRGFDLHRTPLYFVLGSESSLKDQYLFAASGLDFAFTHFPKGRGLPIRWYACEDAIFVVTSHVGSLSDLARSASDVVSSRRVEVPVKGPSAAAVGVTATCWPAEDESLMGDMDSGIIKPPSKADVGYTGTLSLDETTLGVAAIQTGGNPKKPPPQLVAPSRERIDLEQRRLAYLCRLANEERRPYCPINGVLLLLPINLILVDDNNGSFIRNAVRSDMAILIERFGLRFPVIPLVTGWEDDTGFQELRRRIEKLEPGTALKHRFGKGFGRGNTISDPPVKDQLAAMCMQACRSFEDWVYKLFRDPKSLASPGNRALYSLLCKVRRYLYPRLDNVVVEGLGCEDEEQAPLTPVMIGAYFAAAGPHEDTRAFANKVFSRLLEVNEELEWTPAAEAANRRYYTIGYASLFLAMLLAIAIPVMWFLPQWLGE